MEVGIKVMSEDIRSRSVRHTNSCYFTMVALDDICKPVNIQSLNPATSEAKRRFVQAQHRREIRKELEQRYQEIKEESFSWLASRSIRFRNSASETRR